METAHSCSIFSNIMANICIFWMKIPISMVHNAIAHHKNDDQDYCRPLQFIGEDYCSVKADWSSDFRFILNNVLSMIPAWTSKLNEANPALLEEPFDNVTMATSQQSPCKTKGRNYCWLNQGKHFH